VAALFIAALLAGCSSGTHRAQVARSRKPTSGEVSLSALAHANPDWQLVGDTDRAIGRYRSLLGLPALTQAELGGAQVSLPPVPTNALPAKPVSQGGQELRLERLGQVEIARLSQSLNEAEAERIAAEQKIADNREEQSLISSRIEILERLLAVQRAILAGNEAEVINLIIQIRAVREDAKWSATAPDDEWNKIAAQKEAQLASLNGARTRQLDLAQVASDAELRSLEASLDEQSAADVARVRAEIDRENETVTRDQELRLARQREQILAMTRSLQEQETQSISALKSPRPAASGEGAAAEAAAIRSTEAIVARSLPGWRARLMQTIALLTKQRDRQAALVAEETRREALEVAQKSNLRITGWSSAGGGRDLTGVVLDRLRRVQWGEAANGRLPA
jgi:hypothetical protein